MTNDVEIPRTMSRREAVSRIALLMGGSLVGADFILSGTRVSGKQMAPDFSPPELALIDEIGETIIPSTNTPGAKATKIGVFMAMMMNDCYDDRQHAIFRDGLRQIDLISQKQFGKIFLAISLAERTALLNQLNAAEQSPRAGKAAGEPATYFTMMKQLTILGYFTSEIGCTQALRYIESPGAYHGSVPYKKGERAWFNSPARPVR